MAWRRLGLACLFTVPPPARPDRSFQFVAQRNITLEDNPSA
jgi:hypothetical protein